MKKEVTKFQDNGILDFELRRRTAPTPQLRGSCGGCVPGLASWGQRRQHKLCSQRTVVVCFDLYPGSLRGQLRIFSLTWNFPRAEVASWAAFVESIERQVYQPQPPGTRDNRWGKQQGV